MTSFKSEAERLAQKDPDMRRSALERLLQDKGFEYEIQYADSDSKKLRPEQNYLIKTGGSDVPHLLFCAHYDAAPGSFGANDNASGACVLAELAKVFSLHNLNGEFAFFDAEEDRFAGSSLYVKKMDKGSLTGAVNLDLCGYGDTIVLLDKGYLKKKAFRPFSDKTILQRHGVRVVKYLPESDDVSFRSVLLPSLSLAVVPRWDVQYLNALSTFGSGFFGRLPEFALILDQMEIQTTMHGGFRDTPEYLQEEAMQRAFAFLLDACGLRNY